MWRPVFAIIGVLFIFVIADLASLPQYKFEDINPATSVDRIIAPPLRQLAPKRSEWRKEQSLQAQMEMAEQAKWMLIATCIGVLVALYGLLQVMETLRAAQKMNEITRKAFLVDQRPWVSIDDLSIIDFDITQPSNGRYPFDSFALDYSVTLRNSGKIPAVKLKWNIISSLRVIKNQDNEIDELSSLLNAQVNQPDEGIAIAPNNTFFLNPLFEPIEVPKDDGHFIISIVVGLVYEGDLESENYKTTQSFLLHPESELYFTVQRFLNILRHGETFNSDTVNISRGRISRMT